MPNKERIQKTKTFVQKYYRYIAQMEQVEDVEMYDRYWWKFINEDVKKAINYSNKTYWKDIRQHIIRVHCNLKL